MVQTKAHIVALLHQHASTLKTYGVRRCGIFGSFARNQQTDASDVDVLVEFDPAQKTFDNFMHVALLLEDLFQRRVDLLTPESLSPYIGAHILQEVEYVVLTA